MTGTIRTAVDIDGSTVEVGTVHVTHRGTLSATFRYHDDYLSRRGAYAIDPSLPLFSGNLPSRRGLPGAFADCSPDRWGRNLVGKQIRAAATLVGRTTPTVTDVDYLLGVSDLTRQGALRVRVDDSGPFLSPDLTVPRLIELPRLLRAADAVARDDDPSAIKDLLDAGSGSLGGARPKASVRDGGRLAIAKFPHHHDDWSVIAWEMTALDLAERAGIETPARRLIPVHGQPVLVLDRFDRARGDRVGYISAMTLVEGTDGVPGDYVEIAELLPEHGARTGADLRQLWRRIAFSIAIHNTDDHLRNHGFLRARGGWQLSPVFDVNPNPDLGASRITAIGGITRAADEAEALMEYAGHFDLTADQARSTLRDVIDAVTDYEAVAAGHGISAAEIARFSGTFESQRARLAIHTAEVSAAVSSITVPGHQTRVPKGRPGAGRFASAHRADTPRSS